MDLIFDVDTGIDDALALIYAALHPDLRILAVTCVAGNAGLDSVVDNTRGVLDLMGLDEVPLAAGARGPLLGQPHAATWVHGKNGIGDIDLAEYGVAPRPASSSKTSLHAVELIRKTVAEAENPVTVVVLGPMTNLALALRMYPEISEGIERVAVMGGAYEVGNATPMAEFNTWHDPEAAQICFESGIPTVLYGLEVFYSARMTASDLHALRRHGSAPARLAAELGDALAKPYKDEPRVNTGDYVSCLGDAGLVVALAEPDVLTTTVYPVSVSLHDPLTRGQTVVDRRYREEEPMFLPKGIDAPLLNVGTKLDGDRCVRAFVDVVTAK